MMEVPTTPSEDLVLECQILIALSFRGRLREPTNVQTELKTFSLVALI